MKKGTFLKVYLTFLLMLFIFAIVFLIVLAGATTITGIFGGIEDRVKYGKCYDRWNNEIIGEECKIEYRCAHHDFTIYQKCEEEKGE